VGDDCQPMLKSDKNTVDPKNEEQPDKERALPFIKLVLNSKEGDNMEGEGEPHQQAEHLKDEKGFDLGHL
jgi:hypothetical protein